MGAKRNFDGETIKNLVSDYQSDTMPVKAIRKKYNLSSSAFYKILKRCKIVLKSERRLEERPAELPQAVRDYQKKKPIRVILEKNGISQGTLYNMLAEHKIPRRKHYSYPRYKNGKKFFNSEFVEGVMDRAGAPLVEKYGSLAPVDVLESQTVRIGDEQLFREAMNEWLSDRHKPITIPTSKTNKQIYLLAAACVLLTVLLAALQSAFK